MKRKITIETTENEDTLVYHLTMEVSAVRYQKLDRPLSERSQPFLERLGETGKKLAIELMSIEGVEQLAFKPYSIEVRIGVAYEADDVDPHVLATITGAMAQKFGIKVDDIDIDDQFK